MNTAVQETSSLSSEQKISRFVENLLDGTVINIERLPRWRPAWNLDLNIQGKVLQLHARGERGGDVSPFPELKREADILTLIGQQAVPVPHIYGMCEDPQAIIMQRVVGTRDISQARSKEEQLSIAKQYVDAMAKMHHLPVDSFACIGLTVPEGASAISLAGLEAYYPLYARNKSHPQPLIEFALNWLRRNVPLHRTRPALIQYDSGQYLFDRGRVRALYDFEFAMIGDPLADLASARMRDNYEPLGSSFSELYKYYQQVTGEAAEPDVVRFHTALFSTVSAMQFSSTVTSPESGAPHDTYIEFDIALRRVIVHSLAECMGVDLVKPQQEIADQGPNRDLLMMLSDAVEHIHVADDFQKTKLNAVRKLVEYLGKADAMMPQLQRQDLEEANALLGEKFNSVELMEAGLERFVHTAGPEHDLPLLTLFASQIERRVQGVWALHSHAS